MRIILLSTLLAFTSVSQAQTLFTYGPYRTDAKTFLQAFEKNNTTGNAHLSGAERQKAIREYLPLYINSRLKVQEARARRFDTLSTVKGENDNLRNQVVDNYMADPAVVEKLVNEASRRSQKDIHAAHIYIAFRSPTGDTANSRKKLAEVEQKLAAGADFSELATQYSDAPGAKEDKGDIGYITAFTLPYLFENAIYNTSPGKYSTVITSGTGYHIFKNIEDRPAMGIMEAQQILVAFSPKAGGEEKKQKEKLADSLYQLLNKGEDFGILAGKFSDDYISAARNGKMDDINTGEYNAGFEKMISSLSKDGDYTRPFLTAHGWHIVKRNKLKPAIGDISDKVIRNQLLDKIKQDDRWLTTRDAIAAKVDKMGFKKAAISEAALWAFTDSILDNKPTGLKLNIGPKSTLFTIGKNNYPVSDWITYAQANRFKQTKRIAYPELIKEYARQIKVDYYRSHLEDFNPEFRTQMNEFADGNLFFEIMQREVWDKAQNETAKLKAYFEKNKGKYNWGKNAEAVIFFSPDEALGKTLYEKIKANPADWKKITEPMGAQVMADSGRFEWEQIPGLNGQEPQAGMLTSPALNNSDNTYSFAFVQEVHTTPSPRSFEEARGLVLNDYQQVIEQQWLARLKKKYPVVINQKVLEQISK